MRLGEMSREHLITLAKRELGLCENEIIEIVMKDGMRRLYWQTFDSAGSIYITDNMVIFLADDYRGKRHASIETLRFVAELGYDIL
jgi:hypothetical protein